MRPKQTGLTLMGWIAVGISTVFICYWAFWGIIENFHEGWYYESWWANMGLMLTQYLSPMLLFMGVTVISINWRRAGALLHGLLALFAIWFFDAFSNAATFLLIIPLIGLGVLYWFGRPSSRKVALALAVGLPLLTLVAAGIEPVWRVSRRLDDGSRQARLVAGNGITLIWAPAGSGWPPAGDGWHEAQTACAHLDEVGASLATSPQDIWRLPTVAEAVQSMMRGGRSSQGVWDTATAQASYAITPDKESPLWDVKSQVIYWWTATELDETHAYMIAYDGQVWSRAKAFRPAFLGFRCIRES